MISSWRLPRLASSKGAATRPAPGNLDVARPPVLRSATNVAELARTGTHSGLGRKDGATVGGHACRDQRGPQWDRHGVRAHRKPSGGTDWFAFPGFLTKTSSALPWFSSTIALGA